MPSIGTATFTNASDYEASFPLAKINLVFASGAEFKARLTSISLPNLQLLSAEEWLPRIAYVELKPKSVFIGLPGHVGPPPIWGGTAVEPGEVVFHSRGDRIHQRTGGKYRWAALSLAPEHLTKFARVLTGAELPLPPAARVILRPPRRAAMLLQRLHEKACRLARTHPDLITQREVARAMEQEILHALVNCLESAGAVDSDDAMWQRRARIMGQFEDVLARHLDCPLRTADLCESVGVSAKTLRACCQASVGMSPSQYDRLKRLNLARSALRQSDSSAATSVHFVQRYGFSEPGSFSALYRSVFGEAPRVNASHAQ